MMPSRITLLECVGGDRWFNLCTLSMFAQLNLIKAIVRLCFAIGQTAIVRLYMAASKSIHWPEHVILQCDRWRCTHFN